jgi:N-methylhydantoinase A
LSERPTRVGVDVGGTFTDFVLLRDGRLTVHKRLSTPDQPEASVLAGLGELDARDANEVVHGSTVATNALIQRRGARTALIATAGFADVIEIGRQNRPRLYELRVRRPPPLVPRAWRFEVAERVDHLGEIVQPLRDQEVDRVVDAIAATSIQAVAVCLLFSFLRPEHEERLVRSLASRLPDVYLSRSSEVLPEFREYERTSTTVANAYVGPLMRDYLERLQAGLRGRLRVMLSSGGSASAGEAGRRAAHTVLSGPAGGVMGAFRLAQLAGFDRVITFDMGGTSTDVALCDREVPRTSESEIGGCPVRLPALDVHSVGAGGGSLAYRDIGGALAVGPQSAGAEPGPACYGRGDRAAVTDANLLLRRISAANFLGGRMRLDEARAAAALAELALALGETPEAIARGVLRVANAHMEQAIRRISVERGHDPRGFTLVAFGGAGPLHAAALAEALGIPRVLVPRDPGVLSALGMLLSDVVREYTQTVMRPAEEAGRLAEWFSPLYTRARSDLAAEGFAARRTRFEPALDLRYAGQSYELTLTLPRLPVTPQRLAAEFHKLHLHRYQFSRDGAPIEIVNLRLRASGQVAAPEIRHAAASGPSPQRARIGRYEAIFDRARPTALLDRALLRAGNRILGPALVVQLDATTLIPPGWRAEVDALENLILSPR